MRLRGIPVGGDGEPAAARIAAWSVIATAIAIAVVTAVHRRSSAGSLRIDQGWSGELGHDLDCTHAAARATT